MHMDTRVLAGKSRYEFRVSSPITQAPGSWKEEA